MRADHPTLDLPLFFITSNFHELFLLYLSAFKDAQFSYSKPTNKNSFDLYPVLASLYTYIFLNPESEGSLPAPSLKNCSCEIYQWPPVVKPSG